ncbi:MAG: large subunit ribosomal protein L29 [Verrucomicrobia bacterium]|jgi:large subunit ribosomal protein L29|nr:MAG: large subunit ribosomal protein L29 [Verrucomicrobiota bacterium]
MKLKDLREQSVENLVDNRRSLKQELLNLRIQQRSGQLENPARIRAIRRTVARIETLMKELAHARAAAVK